MSTHSRIDTTLYASAALAIVLALGAVGWAAASRQPLPQYELGDRFDDIPNLNIAAAPSTLIVWVNSRCGACTASMPFYQRLTATPRRTQVVVMGRQSLKELDEYLAAYGVRPAQAISVGNLPLKFRGTPTVMLIGSDSIVRSIWYGRRQTIAEEEDIIKRLD